MKYHYKTNIDRRKRRLKTTRRGLMLLFVIIVLVFLVLAWLGLQYMWGEISTKESPAVDKGYYAGSSKTTYDNGKFSFTSSKNWAVDERSSQPPNKYVYLSQKGPNVDYIMSVYFGDIPKTPTKYALPVRISGGRMSPDLISPKCGDEKNRTTSNAPTAATIAETSYKDIPFVCKIEGFENIVALVHESDGYSLPLANAAGAIEPVSLVFQDLGVNMQLDPVREVINSFTIK